MALTVLCISFLLFLLLGVPVAFSIALSCIATYWAEGFPLELAFQNMISGMNVFSFLAIPFFIFSGELMLHGGIADKIVNFARNLVGHWRGGLGMANVVACTLFGGVSGSPVADVSAMGGVMIPMMKKEGYSADYAVNVTTHASLAGALMPTSHNLIIYAFAASSSSGMLAGHNVMVKGVSIGELMFAGLLPVLVLMVCMLFAAYWVAKKEGYPIRPDGQQHAGQVCRLERRADLVRRRRCRACLSIVIILGCIIMGITTATEAAGIAVTYSLFLTFVGYRTMNWTKLMKAAAKAAKTTGVVLLLIGVSTMFQYIMAILEIPDKTAQLLLSATTNPLVMFFLINLILFLLGTFMDMASTILICTPLFLPLAIQMGMGPVQFGIVMLLNCALGAQHAAGGHDPVRRVRHWRGLGRTGDEEHSAVLRRAVCRDGGGDLFPGFSTWIPSLIKGAPVY